MSGNQRVVLQQKQLMELTNKFKELVTEAKKVGETTPRGKELLLQASKIKSIYDNFNKQRSNAAAAGAAGANTGNQLANIIKQVLTPEQNQQYDKLLQDFQSRANNIKERHAFLKQQIDKISAEISSIPNDTADQSQKTQLEAKRNEYLGSLKSLGVEYNSWHQDFQNGKKQFYVECAKQNPALQRLLQKGSQQQQQQQPNAKVQESNVVTQQIPPATGDAKVGTSNASQITNVNATASMASKNSANKNVIFKQSDPSIPISETVSARVPDSIPYKSNRPSVTGGSAMNASSLNTPILTKLPPYEVDTDRVMSKRKLRELIKTVGVDEGDGETVIDGDVEELLLDLADDFVTNVTGFACRLAKHRKSDNLEARDIQLHLERNWNIRIPGYSADEIRSTRKWIPTQAYNQKLQTIVNDKNNSNATTTNTTNAGAGNSNSTSKRNETK